MEFEVKKLVEITDLFPDQNHTDRLNLISRFDKSGLLKILSSINCYPGKFIDLEYSEQDHLDILWWLFSDQTHFDTWKSNFFNLTGNRFLPAVFHRAANLVAIEEILSSDCFEHEQVEDCRDVEDFLKYYLSINSLIVEQQQFNTKQGLNDLEIFISGVSATNELNLPYYPTEDILRCQEIIDYLSTHDTYGKHVNKYFEGIGVSKKMYGVWGLSYIIPIQQSKAIQPPICRASKKRDKILLSRFSGKPIIQGQSPLEALNVKKNPFWDLGGGKYLLLDIQFLIDKSFHSFINELWFDHLSPEGLNRADFMGAIGYFFEEYVGRKFKSCHPKWKNPPVKATNELLVNDGRNQIELADVYLRHSKRVLVGQVKVSAINSKDKYTYTDGGIFRIDRNKFYKTFGVTQMVETTIHRLVSDSVLFDEQFPATEEIEIYPTLIVNERLLLNPTMNLAFQDYFIEQLKAKFGKDIHVPTNRTADLIIKQRFIVKPIVILYVAELELLQIHISQREYRFWDILDNHIQETLLLAPMSYTINKHIGQAYKNYLMGIVFPVISRLASGCFFLPSFLSRFWSNLFS